MPMSAAADAPLNGKRVTLIDLKARPDLNGRKADVLGFNEETGRYTVKLVGSEEQLALRSANLCVQAERSQDNGETFQLGVRVTVKGLTSKPELNGHSGTVTEWCAEKQRYGVQMDNVVKPILLRGENLQHVRGGDWTPTWRTPEGQAAIDKGLADHVREEWEKAKKGFGGMIQTEGETSKSGGDNDD